MCSTAVHTCLAVRVFRDAVTDSFLCLCLGPLFDTGGGNKQPDGLTGGVTDRLPGSDPYPLNTLDARAPFRAKKKVLTCVFSQFWAPPFCQLLFFCDRHIHNVTSVGGCDGRKAD
ncbi:hypothetical protein PAMP_009278 [Pampus punctatissimus]